ncbi:MAG: hypothetical protein GYA24_05360 [Candidatus Lokiarchaeota archaeon]|nr:hypothetical protein [Candidatus Lokiarchaeota archaeon]
MDDKNLECPEDQEENKLFIQKTESLVKPRDVITISFFSDLNRLLPKRVQRAFMKGGQKKVPYMGFIVDPYCFFLAFKITDTAAAQAMLPDGFELVETSIFKGDEKIPMAIAGVFNARTSAFMGLRFEYYIIARNKASGLMSWIICELETNSNNYNSRNGFYGFTCDPAVFTVTPFRELLIDIRNPKTGKQFIISADINKGMTTELDEPLWIDGNLSIDYGGELKGDSSDFFSLIFDKNMMKNAVKIPLDQVKIKANTYMSKIIDPMKPVNAIIFPFSQHFIIKQDMKKGDMTGQRDLCRHVKTFLEKADLRTMKGDDIKKPLFASLCISMVINISIVVFLLVQLYG